MAAQQGRSERRGESYSGPYVELLSDVRTPLAVFFRILLGRIAGEGLFERGNHGLAIADREDQRFLAFRFEFSIGLAKRLCRLERDFRAPFIDGQGHGRIRPSEVVGAGKGETHGESLPVIFPRQHGHLLLRALLQMNGDGHVVSNVAQDAVDIFSSNRFVECVEKMVDPFTSQTDIGLEGLQLRICEHHAGLTCRKMGSQKLVDQTLILENRVPCVSDGHCGAQHKENHDGFYHREAWRRSLLGSLSGPLLRGDHRSALQTEDMR